MTTTESGSRKDGQVVMKPPPAPWREPSATRSSIHHTKSRVQRQLGLANGSCCEACRNIWIWKPAKSLTLKLRLRENRPPGSWRHGYDVDHGTVAQLRARSRCIYCRFIATQIDYTVKTELKRLSTMLVEARRATKSTSNDRHLSILERQFSALNSTEELLVRTTIRYKYSTVYIRLEEPSSGNTVGTTEMSMLSWEDYHRYHDYGYILQSADYLGDTLDAARIRSLLEHCSIHHRHALHLGSGQNETLKLFLIDVKEGRLVTRDVTDTYFALSYVWGNAANFKTTKGNVDSLRVKGALFEEGRVARVIQDAMSIVDALGYRYLWVDAICIVQDDASKAFYVERMDTIYARALCTIVAASSSDATQAVPGLAAGTRPPLKSGFWNGCSLVRTGEPPDRAFSEAPSERRGWTLQERLVSPRLLVFTEHEIFLRCAKETHQENPHNSRSFPRQHENSYNLFHGSGKDSDLYWEEVQKAIEDDSSAGLPLILTYHDLVSTYTKRTLTREDDIYNAFMGIENHITARCGTAFLSALPVAGFAFALMWYSPSESSRRRVTYNQDNGTATELPYPSWSWLAWTQEVRWPDPFDPIGDACSLEEFNSRWKWQTRLTSSNIFITKGQQTTDLRTLQEDAYRNPRPSFDFLQLETDFATTAHFEFVSLHFNAFSTVDYGVEMVDSEGICCGAILGVSMSQTEKMEGTELIEIITSGTRRGGESRFGKYARHGSLVYCLVIRWEGQFAKRVAAAVVRPDVWGKIKVGSKKVLLK